MERARDPAPNVKGRNREKNSLSAGEASTDEAGKNKIGGHKMSKVMEAVKAVKAATTAEEVKTALLGFTNSEMSTVYMEVTGAPFCAWSSRISEVERADSLTAKLMKYKQFGIRQIG